MTPVLARAVVNLAAFLVAGSLLLLLVVTPGTAEQIITLITLGIGLVLGAIAIVFARRNRRQAPHEEDK